MAGRGTAPPRPSVIWPMVAVNVLPRASAVCSGRKDAGWRRVRPSGERASQSAGETSRITVSGSRIGSAPAISAVLLRLGSGGGAELRQGLVEGGQGLRAPLLELSLQAL